MSLRDLILGRKRRLRQGQETAPQAGAGLSRAVIAPEAPVAEEVAPAGETLVLEPPAADPGKTAGPEAGKSRKVVLRRTQSLTVPGALVLEARRQAVLDRLFIVLDPNEVVISGEDRVARLIVANQKLMAAQFSRDGAADLTFDFRPGLQSPEPALACVRVLAEFCTAPVNLMIEEQPVTGVFAGFSGLPVALISFDEGEFGAALDALLSHPDHDHAGAGEEAADEAASDTLPVEDSPGMAEPKLEPLMLSAPQGVDPGAPRVRRAAMPFLIGCRAVAEDVQVHSRAGAEALTGLRATDRFAELPAAEPLEAWRQAVAPVLGNRLVAVLIPADRGEPMVALALDDRDSVLFSFGKQGLGGVTSQALAATTDR